MYRFNRFYLLLSAAASFVIPFLKFEIIRQIQASPEIIQLEVPMVTAMPQPETANYFPAVIFMAYLAVTTILVVRFLKNILKIRRKMQSGTAIDYHNAKLVLLSEETLPHTFLNTIFVNKDEYENRSIEDELYEHELTHVAQKHTLDVLFAETLKTIFWFNPMIYFYKKAIQLNHEFLADEKVVQSYNNVPFYQTLLLSRANTSHVYSLASNLNYSITKKRLIMMTKTTSQVKSTAYKLALFPVCAVLILLLCVETVAQEKPLLAQNTVKPMNESRNDYYAGVRFIVKMKNGTVILDKKYEELSDGEKGRYIMYTVTPRTKKSPSAKQFEELKDKSKHAIWIDDKHVENSNLAGFTPNDIAYFTTSAVFKNARSKKFPQPFQSHLYTHSYFDKHLKDSHKKFTGDTIQIIVNDDLQQNKKTSGKLNIKKNIITPIPILNNEAPESDSGLQDDQIYTAVEIKPEFPGGIKEFYNYVMTNFKIPAGFKGKGRIIAQFVVEKDGSLSGVTILRDVGFGTDKETERVLLESPKWKPGMQNGKPVRVMYALPISLNEK